MPLPPRNPCNCGTDLDPVEGNMIVEVEIQPGEIYSVPLYWVRCPSELCNRCGPPALVRSDAIDLWNTGLVFDPNNPIGEFIQEMNQFLRLMHNRWFEYMHQRHPEWTEFIYEEENIFLPWQDLVLRAKRAAAHHLFVILERLTDDFLVEGEGKN